MYQDKIKYSRLPMRSDIIAEAREWMNTPYQHQAMVKGVGVDCVGLVVGVGINTGAMQITDKQVKEYSGYSRLPNPNRMKQAMERHLIKVSGEVPLIADIAWLQWRAGLPMHLALLSEHNGRPTLIHSLGDVGKVVEHSLNDLWESRIVSFWRYPEVN